MNRLYLIFLLALTCFCFFGQVRQIDLYADFQKSKPKYKKSVLIETRLDNDDEPDTISVTSSEWTETESKVTTYRVFQFHGNCHESTTISSYDSTKRNIETTKHFSCGKLTGQSQKIKYVDSVFRYESDTLIFRSKYNKNNKTWTFFWQNGKRDYKLLFEDSIKTIETSYHNDIFEDSTITFKRLSLSDSVLVFDRSNKLIYKVVERFNKYGDIIYEEKFDNNPSPQLIKSTYTYIYDKNNYWIKKSTRQESFPKDNVKRLKTIFTRILTY